jgi:hypothetical protein
MDLTTSIQSLHIPLIRSVIQQGICKDTVHVIKFRVDWKVIASRPFRLRSKCSICSRRFESRRWSHWGQALSSGFLDIGQDHPSSLGPVPRIVSTLQCRRVRSTPVSFGTREPHYHRKLKCKHRGEIAAPNEQEKKFIDKKKRQTNAFSQIS